MCPVCSLRFSLEHTKSAVSHAFSLFVSPRSPSRQISKNTVWFFLMEVISGAGAVSRDVVTPLRVHNISGVATSTVFMQNWSVSKVLEAASWRSNSVFAAFTRFSICYGRLAIPWPHCGCGFSPSFGFLGLFFSWCERFRVTRFLVSRR